MKFKKLKIFSKLKKNKKSRFVFRWLKRLLIAFLIITILPVIVFKWAPVPYTPLMVIRHFENKELLIQKKWVPIEEISVYLPMAAVVSEDDKFLDHSGFDLDAIQKAFKNNTKNGKRIKGGSTISQQTAKNVFLWPERNWLRKGLEAYFTLLIEIVWGKERIMEVYLNICETGDGIFGAEAASQAYFHKPAKELTKGEAANIIAILPNPRLYPINSAFGKKRKTAILRRMKRMEELNFGQ